MRCDIHTHAFHPKIASKVLAQLNEHYGIKPVGQGTVEDLLARAKAANLDTVVIHSAATDAAQVVPANNFAIELQKTYDMVRAFGTVHPDYPDMPAELDRLAARGITGLKVHCDFQGFRMDDPRLYDIVEMAANRFVFMFHVGDALPPAENPSCPLKFARLRATFPDTPMIAAHFGGYRHWEHALLHLIGSPAYIDTSSTLDFVSDDLLHELYSRHPRERILFGSDYPLYDPATEAEKLARRLHLADSELDSLLDNAGRLLTH